MTQQVLQPDFTTSDHTPAGGIFLVASDGREDSDAAFQLASQLAGNDGEVRSVAVVDQINLVPEGQLLFSAEVETARRNELWWRVQAQMQRTLGRIGHLELEDGDPARQIAQAASRMDARLIVAGIGRHGISARLFGNETVLRIMRLSDVPVLAVARDLHQPPRRIVVAVDFSHTSIRALELAISIAPPGATIAIAHVCPRDSMLYDNVRTYKENLLEALQALREKMGSRKDVVFSTVLLQGDPATELLALTKSFCADLIATGSHGHGFISRLVIGSVTTCLIRGSACSVLAVPRSRGQKTEYVREF